MVALFYSLGLSSLRYSRVPNTRYISNSAVNTAFSPLSMEGELCNAIKRPNIEYLKSLTIIFDDLILDSFGEVFLIYFAAFIKYI